MLTRLLEVYDTVLKRPCDDYVMLSSWPRYYYYYCIDIYVYIADSSNYYRVFWSVSDKAVVANLGIEDSSSSILPVRWQRARIEARSAYLWRKWVWSISGVPSSYKRYQWFGTIPNRLGITFKWCASSNFIDISWWISLALRRMGNRLSDHLVQGYTTFNWLRAALLPNEKSALAAPWYRQPAF